MRDDEGEPANMSKHDMRDLVKLQTLTGMTKEEDERGYERMTEDERD